MLSDPRVAAPIAFSVAGLGPLFISVWFGGIIYRIVVDYVPLSSFPNGPRLQRAQHAVLYWSLIAMLGLIGIGLATALRLHVLGAL